MISKNKADKIIRMFDKNFKHRWERYKDIILENVNSNINWIDCGCGNNEFIKEYGKYTNYAVGLDLLEPEDKETPFIKSSVTKIPFKDNEIDLASFRFVVEHLPKPETDLFDLQRALKEGAKVIVVTTNIINPIIALGRIFPYSIKHKIIKNLFKVNDDDIFPTYHKINSPMAFKKGIGKLRPIYIEYISDINYVNNIFFYIYLIIHIITKPKIFNCFRSNILCVFEKVK